MNLKACIFARNRAALPFLQAYSVIMSKRAFAFVCIVTCTTVSAIAAFNYFTLQHAMMEVNDARTGNKGVEVFTHYQYFVNPNVLVYDLRNVSEDTSPMDVTRVLLQFADRQKARTFSTVELCHRGTEKFVLKGEFFQKLGEEYGTQNPAYTLRTLPQNIYKLDGTQAFGSWTGGLLGVLAKQMEDFANFHRDWYIDDLKVANKGRDHAG